MKKILIILLFIASPLQAEKIEQLSWFNLKELMEDDNLTYKIIKSCACQLYCAYLQFSNTVNMINRARVQNYVAVHLKGPF